MFWSRHNSWVIFYTFLIGLGFYDVKVVVGSGILLFCDVYVKVIGYLFG